MADPIPQVSMVAAYLRVSILTVLALGLCQCRNFAWPQEKVTTSIQGSSNSGAGVFSVASLVPVDAATGIATNTTITVNFTLPANPATLSYASTNGTCTGSLMVSLDNFVTCVGLSGNAWNGPQNSVTLTLTTALSNSTAYQIRISTALQGAAGETLSAVFTSAGFTTAAPGVLVPSMNTPVDGATAVPITTPIIIDFTYAVNTGTLSYNASAGACTGSVQFSADGFATCLALATPTWTLGNTRLQLTPVTSLGFTTSYRVRVTTALIGAGAESLSGIFTSTGFTTAGPPTLTIVATSPSDAATGIGFNPPIVVTFSAQMNTGTISTNAGLGACSGTIQMSPDNFVNCVGLTSASWSGPFSQVTFTLASALNPATVYKIRITTGVAGAGSEALASTTTTPTGFSTTINPPLAIQAFNSNTKNMLVWQTVAGASSYNLYYATSPGVTTGSGTLLAGVIAPYTHAGLTNGVTYYYIVTGVNGGIVGQPSAEVSASPVAFKTVFVTSATYTGNFGGIAGADASCAGRAGAASVAGQFRAYLSTSTHDAACRALGLTGKLASNCGLPVAPDLTQIGPYKNRNSQVVAATLQAFVANTLSVAVGYDETGSAAGGATPFTGTAGGIQSGVNCSDWTDDNLLSNGLKGSSSSITSTWSSNGNSACSLIGLLPIAPLYCFQY